MNKAQWTDLFRGIKKNVGRYLSLLFIVALGTAFFAGVRSAEPDMIASADKYYDESNLMDVRILGTLGLTSEDVEVINGTEGIEQAEGGYSIETIARLDGSEYILNVMSSCKNMNQMTIWNGRMPVAEDECFMDQGFMLDHGLELGDTILLAEENGEKPEDLKHNTYTIVGSGTWSWYLSWTRGSASIGDGSLDAFMVVPETSFELDYYTVIYAMVHGVNDMNTFSDNYDEAVKLVTERIEELAGERCEIRYSEVYEDAEKALNDARQEVSDGVKELADAEQELQDGETAYEEGKESYNQGLKDYEDGLKELEDAKKELEQARTELDAGALEYKTGEDALKTAQAELEEGHKELTETEEKIALAQQQIDEAKAEVEQGQNAIPQLETKLNELKPQVQSAEKAYESQLEKYNDKNESVDALDEEITALEKELSTLQEEKEDLEEQLAGLSQGTQDYRTVQNQLNSVNEEIESIEEELESLNSEYQQASQELNELKKNLDSAKETYDTALGNQIALETQITELNSKIQAGQQEIAAGEAQIAEAKTAVSEGKKELEAAEKTIASKKTELSKAKEKLDAGEKEYQDGLLKIQESETTLETAKEELADAERELLEARQELEDGWKEYKDKAKEANEKLDEARQKIADGEQDLIELEEGEWYVLGRDTLQNSVEFGMDAERIGAIGKVVPLIFFLVAALVALTTMTRMIEEERTFIGTMKALGYNRYAIAAKYILYAASATLVGGTIGVIVGSKLLPFVIMKAYSMLYNNIQYVLTPLHAELCITSIGLALLCTVGATIMACYKEFLATPAALMRPPVPKVGKRLLLEKIPAIWTRLNFSMKSTVRNLVRYKKRFFMTVFGIGGCTAILLSSFGLSDSIGVISDRQYKDIWHYSASCTIEDGDDLMLQKDQMNKIVSGNASIEDAMLVRQVSLDVYTEKMEKSAYLYVPENIQTMTEYVDLHERVSKEGCTLNEEGVILSEKLASSLGVKAGDTVTIKFDESDRKEVKVSAIVENYLSHYIYMTPGLYQSLEGETPEYNQMFIKFAEGTEEESALAEYLLDQDMVKAVSLVADLQNSINEMMNALNLVVWVLIVAAGLLVFVVLYNLNNINISERRRELASLKVLGFYDMEVAMYIYRENIILTLIGILAGMFMGTWMHQYLITTLEVEIIMFGRSMDPSSYVFSMIMTMVFAFLVNLSMLGKLKQIDMIESLKSVE